MTRPVHGTYIRDYPQWKPIEDNLPIERVVELLGILPSERTLPPKGQPEYLWENHGYIVIDHPIEPGKFGGRDYTWQAGDLAISNSDGRYNLFEYRPDQPA